MRRPSKTIEFVVEVDNNGRLMGPTAEYVRSSLAGHFGGRMVRFMVQGIPTDIKPGKSAFYRTQLLPCFLDAMRKDGRNVDPINRQDQDELNLFLGGEILGYEEKENIVGQKIKVEINPLDLPDSEFSRFLDKAIKLFKDLFQVDSIRWQKEAEKW